MSRSRWTLLGLGGLLVGALIGLAPAGEPEPLAALTGSAAAVPPGPSGPAAPDPFPIRRVYATGDRLKLALADEAKGSLVRLPREAFETRMRSASAAANAPPPRIAEAIYEATLDRGGLRGTATWRIAGTGLLLLDPIDVALVPGTWSDGRPAVLFRSDAPYLLADRPGENAVSLGWSIRATEEPTADRFAIAFPPAAIASMVLTLPVDRTPDAAANDVLVTGPFPGSSADRRLWRLAFGGRTKFELAIRRPGRGGEPPPTARVERSLRYELSPGQVSVAAEFILDATRTPSKDIAFDIDPSLRVTDVTGSGRLSWKVDPGPRPEDPSRIRVSGQDAGAVARIAIVAVAPFRPVAGGWPCPLIRLVDGLPGADAIEVRVDPELAFVGLDPGDFRVASGSTDRSYRINLVGSLSPQPDNRPDRRPPILRIRPADAEYVSTDEITWTLAPGTSEVTARFRLHVSRGPLVQIPVQTTGTRGIESVAAIPEDPGLAWSALPGSPGGIQIEPSRPLAAGQSAEFVVRFRGPVVPAAGDLAAATVRSVSVPFPHVAIAGASERDGTYRVVVRPGLRAWPTVPPPGPGLFTYPFRGRAPDVGLAIVPSTERATVDRDTAVSLDDKTLTATSTLRIRSPDEPLGEVLLFAPSNPGVKWDVRGSTAASIRRTPWLPWLGPGLLGTGWSALAASAVNQSTPGDVWVVKLPRANTDLTLTVIAERPAVDASLPFPLPSVFGARSMNSQFALSTPTDVRFELPVAEAGFPERFRLTRRGVPAGVPADRAWTYERLTLAVSIEADGRLACVLTGRLRTAKGGPFQIALPESATFHGASVAGRVADVVAVDARVAIPISSRESPGDEFEVRYSVPGASGPTNWIRPPVVEFQPPLPTLPGDPAFDEVLWSSADAFRRWPTLASTSPSSTPGPVTAIRANALRATGYALGALVVGLAIGLVGRVGRGSLVPVGFGVAALGLAELLAPHGWNLLVRPSLAAAFLAFAALAVFANRRAIAPLAPRDRTKFPSTVSQRRAGIFLVVSFFASAVAAQAPEPATVFVVPGPAAAPGRLAVLVPPAVLDRIEATGRIPLPPVVIVAADYEGTAEGDGPATIVARYQVFASGPGDKTLTLPLAGVRLEDVQVDAQPAFPEAPKPDRYAVKIPGPGKHEVIVRFVVPTTPLGGDREVRFGCPDVPCTHVRFTAPTGSRQLDVPTRRGVQAAGGVRSWIEADHGSGTTVAVRWRGEPIDTKSAVALRDVTLWELTDVGEVGTAVFAFRVTGGSVARLSVDLPDAYEPSKPVIRTSPGGPGLRDWRLTPAADGFQTLAIGLQGPVEGRVVVVVRLYPKRPGSLRPVLRFPRPGRDVFAEGFVAVRTKGVAIVDLPRPLELIDYAADLMVREFAALAPELGFDRAPPERVFQRAPGTTPELRPAIRPTNESPSAAAEVVWTLGPKADVEGTVKILRPASAFAFEFDLPASIQIREVRGPDLHSWSRSGNRVQVWFRKATRDATIRWTGSWNGYPAGGATPAVLDLPVPRGPSISGPVTVKVHAVEGWSAVVLPSRGVSVPPSKERPEEGLVAVDPTVATLRVTAYSPLPPASSSVAEFYDGVRYRAAVSVSVKPNRPHSFTLRLNGVPAGSEPTAKGPDGAVIGPLHQGSSDAHWTVSLPPTTGTTVSFTLAAKVPRSGRLPEPELAAFGPPIRWTERSLEATGVTVTDGPTRWHSTDANRWSADGPTGAWQLSAIPSTPPERPPTPNQRAVARPSEAASLAPNAAPDYGLSIVWAIGFLAVLTLAVVGREEWWPERLAGCGLTAAVCLDWESFSGMVFLSLAVVGGVCRIVRLLYRLGRVMLR